MPERENFIDENHIKDNHIEDNSYPLLERSKIFIHSRDCNLSEYGERIQRNIMLAEVLQKDLSLPFYHPFKMSESVREELFIIFEEESESLDLPISVQEWTKDIKEKFQKEIEKQFNGNIKKDIDCEKNSEVILIVAD